MAACLGSNLGFARIIFFFFYIATLVELHWNELKKNSVIREGGFLVIDLSQITLHQEVQELIFNLRNRTKLIQYQH